MSRLRSLLRPRDSRGFSLIEVSVALVIFGISIAALVPLLITAVKASTVSKMETQAKQIGISRLEAMRNLPYWVAFDNGQYRDVLDIYFRDRVVNGALEANDPCTARAFVSATNSYRCTINPVPDFPQFTQVVDTQFLDADRAVVAPPANYNARATVVDRPAAQMLGVTITTTWQAPTGPKSSTLTSHITNTAPAEKQLQTRAEATAVTVSSYLLGEPSEFQVIGGSFTADGALSTAASAAVSAVGARASLSSGASTTGAEVVNSAPADAATRTDSKSGGSWAGLGCSVACFGPSEVRGNTSALVSSGVPLVSTPSDMATARLQRGGGAQGFSFTNADASQRDVALQLHATQPMVGFGTSGSAGDSVASASGRLEGTKSPVAAAAIAAASSARLRLLPTTFAPEGVVQLELHSAQINCTSSAGSGSPSSSWTATVWVYSNGSYVSYPISSTSAAQLPDPSTISVTTSLSLDHWIDSWFAATSAMPVSESTGRVAKGTVSSVVSILTQPTRPGDPSSAVSVELGRLGCLVEDNR